MLTPQLDLKLLGNTLPLSEPISDVFDTIKIFEYLYPEPNKRWKEILNFKKFLQK
jgi:hypothetical protein